MTGLRLDTAVGTLRKRLAKLQTSTSASSFRPELEKFAKNTLNDCIIATPVRSETLIAKAQHIQYEHRINFIPSYHDLLDPSLRVNSTTGEAWIYCNAKWYNASWRLPDEVFSAFADLNQERERRLGTIESDFIEQRKQARFLYQRSWWQVGQSLGLALSVGAANTASHTRRKPPKTPPAAYGQWRGGKTVLSVVIVNKFLDVVTAYWPSGNGKQILAQATAKNRPAFYKSVEDKVKREISAARRTA